MSKKLMNALEDCSNEILSSVNGGKVPSGSKEDIIKRMVDVRLNKFINFNTTELDKSFISIGRDVNSLKEKQLIAKQQGSNLEEDELYELEFMDLKMNILEAAIVTRKEVRSKKGDHPVLQKHIDYPIFSVDRPGNVTLAKLQQGNNGLLVEKRGGGYRTLLFQNERGTLLTDYDHRVFAAVCKICLDKGMPKELRVEIGDIVSELKIPNPGGGDYQNIRNSLMDIYSTSIIFQESNGQDSEEDIEYEYHRIFQKFAARGNKFASFTVLFQDYIYEALQRGEFVNINIYLMNDLTLNIAKSLYKFILTEYSKEEKDLYEFDFTTLRNHIDIDRNNTNRARQTIKKGFQELLEIGIIDSVEDVKVGVGNWVYYVQANAVQLRYAAKSERENQLQTII
ncbi:hypothetical protein [Paenibacillus sp. PL91]|uniref:hypothetical protein n=1 Tax=Paenibacillus sp. PL91 TaxID=2729538 RepID=UPI00145E9237|nr:hypothetical protein [Paenibacillus sp. PL91]MBC9204092.1 hypothetical protein [Paenibacillus sp. PL91]